MTDPNPPAPPAPQPKSGFKTSEGAGALGLVAAFIGGPAALGIDFFTSMPDHPVQAGVLTLALIVVQFVGAGFVLANYNGGRVAVKGAHASAAVSPATLEAITRTASQEASQAAVGHIVKLAGVKTP